METILALLLLLSSFISPTDPNTVLGLSQSDLVYNFTTTLQNSRTSHMMRMSNDPVNTVSSATSIVIAIDVSDSMYGVPLQEAQKMAKHLINSVDQSIDISIISFANSAEIVQDYTNDRSMLNQKIDALYTQGVTALYDGAYEAVEMAVYSDAQNRLVILFSDGGEYGEQSSAGRDDALRLAQANDIAIVAVGIGVWTDVAYLDALATTNNGQAYHVDHVSHLPDIYPTLTDYISVLDSTIVLEASEPDYIPPLSTPAPEQVNRQSNPMLINGTKDDAEGDNVPSALSNTTTGQSTSTAIVLTLDISDSMYGFPLERAIDVSQDLVNSIDPSVPIALVTFANEAELIQDFTMDRQQLVTALDAVYTKGATALYDGANLAVEVATTANVTNPVVVLLSDGGEYGGLSTSQRTDALFSAQASGVEVVAVGYGNWIDTSYLTELTAGTNGELLLAPRLDDLDVHYETLAERFNQPNPAILLSDVANGSANVFEGNFLPEDSAIPSIENELLDLNLSEERTPLFVEPESLDLSGDTLLAQDADAVLDAADVLPVAPSLEDEINTLEDEMGISNNIMPLVIDFADDVAVEQVDLSLNGFLLASFTELPVTYDLDLGLLDNGLYKLSMQVKDTNGDIRVVNSEFEVSIITQLPSLGGSDAESDLTPAIDETGLPRLVLIGERAQNLNYTYSIEDGLVHDSVVNVAVVEEPTETLSDILSSPLQYIPEPILIALTTPHPELVAIIIVVMTVVLLPQGLFTLYWMMYTWNHPDKLEESRSPQEFIEPEVSFTALIPARKEQDVIRQTIHSVNNINYPDHLKEILIMIRDDDDDETIAEANRAIEEIGKDHIHVITFTEGPKNKPNGLNRGLNASTKDVVCIFDAEDEPHPDIYHVVNTTMIQKDVDVVQSGVQLMNFDSTWFSAFNVLEYFFWFKSGLHAFTRSFNITPLGGNTVFFKREWLHRVGGWDEQCLTEDADIGFRLTQLGAKIEIVYDETHATQEETPDTAESFIKQRTRWVQGFYQIFFKMDWARLPKFKQKIVALYILLNSLMQAGMLFFLPVGIYIALTQQVPVVLALLSYFPIYILIIQLVMNLIGIREFTAAYNRHLPFGFTLKMILYYYPYQLMMALASIRAVFRMFAGQASWEKTAHSNLHRLAMEN